MYAPIAAIVSFAACLAAAIWLQRGHRERVAFAALLAAPLTAALAFTGAGALHKRNVAPASSEAEAPAATAPAAAATEAASAAPSAGRSMLDNLRREAEEMRRNRRFTDARDAYARITKSAPFDADAWADLGDASAAAAGGDLKAGAQAIDRALELDPNHAKALWLKASLELQDKRYDNALELWQRLLARLPPDSNDARIVSANVAETRALAAQQRAKK